jgi:hypothetical protein
MLLRTTAGFALSMFLLGLAGTMDIAEAKTSTKKTTNPTKKQAKIEGFRSAKFEMKERDVYRAIVKDFKVSKKNVKRVVSGREKTMSLEIDVPKLFEVGGGAKVGYVFGYKSKRLVQVNVVWGTQIEGSGKKAKPQDIVDAANFLREHFLKKEYQKEGFLANSRMNDATTIVFRGKDKKGRMVVLVLSAAKGEPVKKGQEPVENATLKLSYLLDFESPDIFKLTIGENDF